MDRKHDRVKRAAATSFENPLQAVLLEMQRRLSSLVEGEVATYIPELAKANPEHFAISLATCDGHLYHAGDSSQPFTIQSISKPFVYGLALDDHGVAAVMDKVGVEPSGDAFNAISLEPETGRPRNPMINAGAITSASLVMGSSPRERLARLFDVFEAFAGRRLTIDDAVFESERATGHRNRAIGHLLKNAGIVEGDVDEVLDLYFQQCSILATCDDLALMAATLANAGRNPLTGVQAIARDHVARVLTVMSTCGMYDFAGSWAYRVGIPAKSGVGGGIIAVLPGQFGIGVFSPRLDRFGNSVRGVAVCEELSNKLGLHLLRPPADLGAVVRARYSLAEVASKRQRTVEEADFLARAGAAVKVLELQGLLTFAGAEVALRTAIEDLRDAEAIVVDLQRIAGLEEPVIRLLAMFVQEAARNSKRCLFSGVSAEDPRFGMLLSDLAAVPGVQVYATNDLALEACEEWVLLRAGIETNSADELPLALHPMLRDLTPGEMAVCAPLFERKVWSPGDRLISQGDHTDEVYFIVAGSASVDLVLEGGRLHRIQTVGCGTCCGELALIDRGRRTANVEATTAMVTYSLSASRLDSLERRQAPLAKLYRAVARDLAGRLRRANAEITALAR